MHEGTVARDHHVIVWCHWQQRPGRAAKLQLEGAGVRVCEHNFTTMRFLGQSPCSSWRGRGRSSSPDVQAMQEAEGLKDQIACDG